MTQLHPAMGLWPIASSGDAVDGICLGPIASRDLGTRALWMPSRPLCSPCPGSGLGGSIRVPSRRHHPGPEHLGAATALRCGVRGARLGCPALGPRAGRDPPERAAGPSCPDGGGRAMRTERAAPEFHAFGTVSIKASQRIRNGFFRKTSQQHSVLGVADGARAPEARTPRARPGHRAAGRMPQAAVLSCGPHAPWVTAARAACVTAGQGGKGRRGQGGSRQRGRRVTAGHGGNGRRGHGGPRP